MQSSELARTPRGSAVFPQKALKICPALPFVPRKSQRPGPAAFGLAVGLRAGVEDDADGMSIIAGIEVEQIPDQFNRIFGLVGPLQFRVKLIDAGQIAIKRKPLSRRKALTFKSREIGNSPPKEPIQICPHYSNI